MAEPKIQPGWNKIYSKSVVGYERSSDYDRRQYSIAAGVFGRAPDSGAGTDAASTTSVHGADLGYVCMALRKFRRRFPISLVQTRVSQRNATGISRNDGITHLVSSTECLLNRRNVACQPPVSLPICSADDTDMPGRLLKDWEYREFPVPPRYKHVSWNASAYQCVRCVLTLMHPFMPLIQRRVFAPRSVYVIRLEWMRESEDFRVDTEESLSTLY